MGPRKQRGRVGRGHCEGQHLGGLGEKEEGKD